MTHDKRSRGADSPPIAQAAALRRPREVVLRSLMPQIEAEAKDLLRFDGPDLLPAAYDTAFVALLEHSDGSACYPKLFDWILQRQSTDGSWGANVRQTQDRVLSTLAAALLCKARGAGGPLAAACAYLRDVDVPQGSPRNAGFEIVVPALLDDARVAGIDLPFGKFASLLDERRHKLARIPSDVLFAQQCSAWYSLEAFSQHLVDREPENFLLPNGSVFCSPAATAANCRRVNDWNAKLPSCRRYFDACIAAHDGALPHFAPQDVFFKEVGSSATSTIRGCSGVSDRKLPSWLGRCCRRGAHVAGAGHPSRVICPTRTTRAWRSSRSRAPDWRTMRAASRHSRGLSAFRHTCTRRTRR